MVIVGTYNKINDKLMREFGRAAGFAPAVKCNHLSLTSVR